MSALVSAELFRLRSIRSPLIAAGGVLAFVAFLAAMPLIDPSMKAPDVLDLIRVGAGLVVILAMGIFGASSAGGEFRRGTATLGYLVTPRRGHGLAVKAGTYAAVGATFGAVAAALAVGVGLPVAEAQGISVSFPAADIAQLVGGAAFGGALFAVIGVLLGTATRNPTVAVGIVLAWQPLENLLGVFKIGAYLPFELTKTVIGMPSEASPLAAGGLLLAYLALGAALVRWRAVPRDLT